MLVFGFNDNPLFGLWLKKQFAVSVVFTGVK
jgi:hypothetical protein